MEEPNVDEREWAMGFHTNNIVMLNLSKRICRQILGQVMDLNCLTWIFNFCLAKHSHFVHCSPPNHSPSLMCWMDVLNLWSVILFCLWMLIAMFMGINIGVYENILFKSWEKIMSKELSPQV
jgi:hypothetical protein